MNNRTFGYVALSLALALGIGSAFAQPAGAAKGFVPLHNFIENTRAASIVDFSGSDVKVKDEASLEEMRQHILSLYDDVEIRHSFVMNSSHRDCVPTDQQAGVKALAGKEISAAPPQSLLVQPGGAAGGEADHAAPASQFAGQQADEFGNARLRSRRDPDAPGHP